MTIPVIRQQLQAHGYFVISTRTAGLPVRYHVARNGRFDLPAGAINLSSQDFRSFGCDLLSQLS
jgi:hypothetical protein